MNKEKLATLEAIFGEKKFDSNNFQNISDCIFVVHESAQKTISKLEGHGFEVYVTPSTSAKNFSSYITNMMNNASMTVLVNCSVESLFDHLPTWRFIKTIRDMD